MKVILTLLAGFFLSKKRTKKGEKYCKQNHATVATGDQKHRCLGDSLLFCKCFWVRVLNYSSFFCSQMRAASPRRNWTTLFSCCLLKGEEDVLKHII